MKQKIKGKRKDYRAQGGRRVLVAASVASMIDQFNLPNIRLLQELGEIGRASWRDRVLDRV